jgi:hypothetical protein
VENVTGFVKYATARNIAHTGVNMMLRALDRNDTAMNTKLATNQTVYLSQSLMGGQCSVTVKLKNPAFLDTVDMTSRAKFLDTSKNMVLRLRRQPIPFPTIGAAVGLKVDDVDFEMDGTPRIDGRNHDVNGVLLPPSANDLPAVGVVGAPESSKVAPYGGKLYGTQDVVVDPGMIDPSAFVEDYVNAADQSFVGGTYASNMVWGTATSPQIIYVDGTDQMVKFTGTIVGWGIMVVKGSVQLSGNFTFHGLVIGYNDVHIEKDTLALTTGTPDIIGAVLMAGGDASRFYMKGTDQISYSKDALNLAKYINKLQVYRVIRWYE